MAEQHAATKSRKLIYAPISVMLSRPLRTFRNPHAGSRVGWFADQAWLENRRG